MQIHSLTQQLLTLNSVSCTIPGTEVPRQVRRSLCSQVALKLGMEAEGSPSAQRNITRSSPGAPKALQEQDERPFLPGLEAQPQKAAPRR